MTLGLFLFGWSACGSDKNGKDGHHQSAVDENGPEYTSAYICPMHCEGSGSAEPGKCPTCGMDYVQNKNAETAPVEQMPDHGADDSMDTEEHMGDEHDHMHGGEGA